MWTLDGPRCYRLEICWRAPLGIDQDDTRRRSIWSYQKTVRLQKKEEEEIHLTHWFSVQIISQPPTPPLPFQSSGDRNIEAFACCVFSMNGAQQYLWDFWKAVQPLWK